MLSLTGSASELVKRYLRIKVLGFDVPVGYYMNERGLRNTPLVYSGKARPEEIEAEANRVLEPKKKEIVDGTDVVNLMTMFDLGVDCSGLVANVLALEVKEKTGRDLWSELKQPTWYRKLVGFIRPRTVVSAEVLSGKDNAMLVDLGEVRPGDMIRRGRGHVMLVEWVEEEKLGYVESNMRPRWGVQRGEIRIVKPKMSLDKQEWSEEYALTKYVNALPDAGLRRLRMLT